MKIPAGILIAENLTVSLLKRRGKLGPFEGLNRMRLGLAELPGMPEGDWTDFGRGSQAVRRMMLSGALTSWDYGRSLPPDTGVIGWNGCGCTSENLRFWQDYVQSGRQNGRGGLFVATLPTIPFCEAAIAFGWKGPSAYCRTEQSTNALFRLVSRRPAGMYLIGEITEKTVCTLLLEADRSLPDLPDFDSLAPLFSFLENLA